jgi:hypothetical protein
MSQVLKFLSQNIECSHGHVLVWFVQLCTGGLRERCGEHISGRMDNGLRGEKGALIILTEVSLKSQFMLFQRLSFSLTTILMDL